MRSQHKNRYGLSLSASILMFLANVSLTPFATAQTTDFEKATKLYAQKQYKPAFALFSAIYAADHKNLTALFYCANCQLAAGQKADAIKAYTSIVAASPGSAAGIAAKSALQSVDASSSATSLAISNNVVTQMQTASIGKAAAINRANAAPGEIKSTHKILSGDAKTQEIEEIVQTVRAQADHPNISESFVSEAKQALTEYPTPLLHLLAKKGIHIKLTPTMIDNDPSLAYQQPRGYEDGKTFKNCPGLFDGYDIVVCEYEFIGDSNDVRKCQGPMGTLRHELGHAVDRCLGGVSRKEEFRHLYLLDIGTIDDEVKNKIGYYLQKDKAGPAETFAEIMCHKYGGRPAGDGRKPEEVAGAFKMTTAYINKLIANIPPN
jgi:tetratricopeptide (TPR) repeat protein